MWAFSFLVFYILLTVQDTIAFKLFNVTNKSSLTTRWPPEFDYPDCNRLFHDEDYAKFAAKQRVTIDDDYEIPTENCSDFYARGNYLNEPLSKEEAEFPIAFANTVFKDFALLERVFHAIYAPQNFYCYAIDSKASETFKLRLKNLAKCFSNVFIAKEEFSIFSNGKNVTAAHRSCMEILQPAQYKYLILLQNHDVPLKTNAELVKIFKIYNGANDISTLHVTPTSFDPDAKWDISELNLLKNETAVQSIVDKTLYLTKSSVSVSISKEFVNFILNDLNTTKFVNQLENWWYGMDENFISTINSNDVLNAPGGFTRACLLRNWQVASITRTSTWSATPKDCKSETFRHDVCLYGVEDLERLSKRRELFANKFMPSFDYGAAVCLLEAIYNRTHLSPETDFSTTNNYEINTEYYATLPHVRYNRKRRQLEAEQNAKVGGKPQKINLFRFNCGHPYQDYYF